MYKFCIAPMMDWSDKHCRYFWRLLTKKSRLYTEMITTGAIIHGDAARYLAFKFIEPLINPAGYEQVMRRLASILVILEWHNVRLNCWNNALTILAGRKGPFSSSIPSNANNAMRKTASIKLPKYNRFRARRLTDR